MCSEVCAESSSRLSRKDSSRLSAFPEKPAPCRIAKSLVVPKLDPLQEAGAGKKKGSAAAASNYKLGFQQQLGSLTSDSDDVYGCLAIDLVKERHNKVTVSVNAMKRFLISIYIVISICQVAEEVLLVYSGRTGRSSSDPIAQTSVPFIGLRSNDQGFID
ncbi:hypothetical protein NL676_006548 [Syzygium grande]|nr:hypothetical protein NL676_006548 [Syzygium grande]